AANRVSYAFDLRGPSQVVSAACASSLAALQAACQQLWLGEADQALVGAAELMLAPDSTLSVARTGMLSQSGRCRSLDPEGDGCVRGEGGAMLVLNPLHAVTPNERIYALVRGVEVSHNGHNEWIVAPSEEGQRRVIETACRKAGVEPS